MNFIDKLKKNKLFMQIFRFGIVGFTAFFIDYGIMVISKELLGFNILISAALGFVVSVIFNYIASIKCFFDVNKEKDEKRNFLLFILFSIIGLILTEIIMYIGTDVIKISYLIVKIIATAIVMIFNFITRKKFLE